MKLVRIMAALAGCWAAGGCGGAAAARDAAWPETCRTPEGDPSESSLAVGTSDLHGFTVTVSEAALDAPAGAAFDLSVAGPTTRRRIVVGGDAQTSCGMLPSPTDPCSEVGIGVFATDLETRLVDVGLGGGVYIDHVEVHDWAELDRVALAVTDALRAWRIAGSFRVEVRPMNCMVEELGRS